MKKKITVLALALTLCGAFAAFPVSAHEAEIITETGTVMTEPIKTEEKVIHLSERELDKKLNLRQYIDGVRGDMAFTTVSTVAHIDCYTIRIDKIILDWEMYADIPGNEVIVECKIGTYRGMPERRVTLRFICERDYSSRTDVDSWGDTDETEDDGLRPLSGGNRTDLGACFNPDKMLNTSGKINKSSLFEMSNKTSFTAVSGVTISPAIISSNITAPSGLIYNERISSDSVLSHRYNTEETNPMTLKVPSFSSTPKTIRLHLENENVTSLISSNYCEKISGGTVNHIYAYNINNSFESLAKGS